MRRLGISRALARRLAMALVAVLVATGFTALTTTSAHAAARGSVSSMAPDTYEKRVQYWINQVRRDRGLRVLRLASCTDRVAERWSTHLASTEEFFHQSMQTVLDDCNAEYAGETLGRGAITPRRLVKLWMESDGHRAILISNEPHRIGIGAKPDAYGRWVTTANFMRF